MHARLDIRSFALLAEATRGVTLAAASALALRLPGAVALASVNCRMAACLGEKYYTPELTKVKFHWKMPLDIWCAIFCPYSLRLARHIVHRWFLQFMPLSSSSSSSSRAPVHRHWLGLYFPSHNKGTLACRMIFSWCSKGTLACRTRLLTVLVRVGPRWLLPFVAGPHCAALHMAPTFRPARLSVGCARLLGSVW